MTACRVALETEQGAFLFGGYVFHLFDLNHGFRQVELTGKDAFQNVHIVCVRPPVLPGVCPTPSN